MRGAVAFVFRNWPLKLAAIVLATAYWTIEIEAAVAVRSFSGDPRFRDLLVDLSKDTQFIIITHNRNTVQAADVIYGVTMGRDSASQIISLRLDQVTDDMLKRG